jgi:hypothetical protein
MICEECVSLESLKALIKEGGNKQSCNYCETGQLCIESKVLFDFVEQQTIKALKPVHELSGYEQAMIFECGSDEPPVFPLWEFFQNIEITKEQQLEEDIAASCTSDFFNDPDGNEPLFTIDDGTLEDSNDYEDEWEKFIHSIHHDRRYFNRSAEAFLDSLFEILMQDGQLQDDFIQTFEADVGLYRARIANSKADLAAIEETPHSQLGPVPKEFASNQRMTPAGISAIYCALDRNTCLSELRSIVGDLVVSGEFRPITPLKLLNLNALESIPHANLDPLDVNFRKYSHAQAFLKGMIYKLSRPLARQDDLGYLSTQVFFEYLRVKFGGAVDGLQFPSVQVDGDGINLALFPEASVVIDENGLEEWDKDNPLNGKTPRLVYVEKSLVFHKIQAVKITSKDTDFSFPHTANELTRNRLGF